MPKRGTPSSDEASATQFADFAASVIKNLPRDRKTAECFARENGEELNRRLRALSVNDLKGRRDLGLELELRRFGFEVILHEKGVQFPDMDDCPDWTGPEDVMTSRGLYDVRILKARGEHDFVSTHLQRLAEAGAWFVGLRGVYAARDMLRTPSAKRLRRISSFSSRKLTRETSVPRIKVDGSMIEPRKVRFSGICYYTTFRPGDGLIIVTKA
jgi:hypothetical protein